MDVDGVGTKAQPLFSRRIQPDSHSYPKLALALETASLIAEVLRFLVLVTSVYENQSINRQAWHRVGMSMSGSSRSGRCIAPFLSAGRLLRG